MIAQRKSLLMVLFALFSAILLIKGSSFVNEEYYKKWPLQGDTASYWVRDLRVAETAVNSSFPAAVIKATVENARDPLRTVFFIFSTQKNLQSINGHLYFSGFTAFLFLLSLGICLWRRTNYFIYALAGSVATLTLAGLFNPMYGLPSKLPDMPAAFLFGTSLFLLMSARTERDWRWFLLSGMALGLATLTRYHTWLYGGVVLGPLILLYAFEFYRESDRELKAFLLPLLAFALGLSIVAGWFIVHWASVNFNYYATAGYSLNQTVGSALNTTGKKFIFNYVGIPSIILFISIMIGYVAKHWTARKNVNWLDFSRVLWAAVSFPILLFIIMRVEDIVEQSYYMMPGLVLLCLTPFILKTPPSFNTKAFRKFSLIMLGVALLTACLSFYFLVTSKRFTQPPAQAQALFEFNKNLASKIFALLPEESADHRIPVIDTNFDYYARYLVPEIELRFGRLVKFGKVFQIRQSKWQMSYTGVEAKDEVLVVQDLRQKVDVFAALATNVAAANDRFKDDYTKKIAEYVNEVMQKDNSHWESRGKIASPFGELILYKNKVTMD